MSQGIDKVADCLPLLPLKDIVVFPQMILPVFVSEDICMRAVEAACAKDRFIFLSAFRSEINREHDAFFELRVSTPPPFDVYDVGTVATVMRTRKLPDGRTKVLIQGVSRAMILGLKQSDPYPVVSMKLLLDKESSQEGEALCRSVKEQLEKIVPLGRSISPDLLMLIEDVTDVGRLANLVASNLGLKIVEAQKVLATSDPFERLRKVHTLLLRELESYNYQSRSFNQSKEESVKSQREQYLREQLKALKHELGELDGKEEIEDLKDKILKAGMTPEAQTECLKQARRLERMNQDSSEATLTRTYLEWMIDIPWVKISETKIDMSHCKKILDEDHYGLDKIKDRILEYIAVKKLNPELKGPILCFVGPPGVGKTSLGRSIARALGRKFVRISLGGVRDEAEIRGHRRTYVGAMPGRIIQTLKTVGTRNPVMMLDEIDKLGSDYKGDPASALLEVLDPEQNHTFSDHYISVPFDLSQIIFLANANRLDTIPAALRDRLEIIEVSGYSEEEKTEITRQYIIPKVIEQNGLNTELVQFQDTAVNLVINAYTRESGLRSLEKHIATITRKLARYIAENDEKGKDRKLVKVTAKMAKELLGEERYFNDDHDIYKQRVGVGVGLAYTQAGGEILQLEVKLMKGSGKLTLTGQLGDVMKESAQTALSCVRSLAAHFQIDGDLFTNQDIHLHVPAGAIPKDGPSAGIAIAVALVSAFSNKTVRQDVAVTGEITLHGRVLPIGGVREKVLAALRAGIRKVCLPEKNKGSFAELPLTIRRRIDVRFVSTLEDVIKECFDQGTDHENVEKNQNVKDIDLLNNENISSIDG
ncbi:endopeptidase La [Silvanigrella aquatica]|uniref:Lon protease n=1 Tax=Silvanigrella aquatica TaxID=1915309 RepID=A0A1L4D052_9BACT|nr:endopeptidase La [Silvanigrella aquatica]APJ03581.1 endopeptidase La [Silvanigrella aquatica]